MGEPSLRLHAANATTVAPPSDSSSTAPVRTQLGMNSRGNVLARAIARTRPSDAPCADTDQCHGVGPRRRQRSSCGSGRATHPRSRRRWPPGKYAGYHIVENEEDTRVEATPRRARICRRTSVVTVFRDSRAYADLCARRADRRRHRRDAVHYLIGTGRLGPHRFLCGRDTTRECRYLRARWLVKVTFAARSSPDDSFRCVGQAARWIITGGLMDRRGAPVQPGDDDIEVAIAATADDVLVVVAGAGREHSFTLCSRMVVRHVRDSV